MQNSTCVQEIDLHSFNITQALIQATLNPSFIYDFLESQTGVFKRINLFNKNPTQDELPNDEFVRNEITITQASILKELIDNDRYENYEESLQPSLEKVKQHGIEIKRALIYAGLDPFIISSFLSSQLEVFKDVNQHNRKKFARKEYERNQMKIEHVSLLINAIS